MQQRRLRPGDVLDDYCPRERRITDHAIVAMIDDNIKQTRCVVCDAEHEYKQGKVPPQRRKKAGAGLFSQVLDGLQAPARAPQRAAATADVDRIGDDGDLADVSDAELPPMPMPVVEAVMDDDEPEPESMPLVAAAADAAAHADDEEDAGGEPMIRDEGPVRRSLIRATLPRPEGQQPPVRAIPEFTIRQPMNGRGNRPGRGRRGGGQQSQHGSQGPMRFGRGSFGQRSQGGGRTHGNNNGRSGGPRRGGKKR